jgi:hypothetical protein
MLTAAGTRKDMAKQSEHEHGRDSSCLINHSDSYLTLSTSYGVLGFWGFGVIFL